MLLDLKKLQEKHGFKIRGVISVGAHYGEEHDVFVECGAKHIFYIEPLMHAYTCLLTDPSLTKDENVKCFVERMALGNINGTTEMFVDIENHGQSSSILQPKYHLKYYPEIQFVKKEKVKIKRLDDLSFPDYRENFNCISIDVQGYELEVFKGAKNSLNHINVIYSEVNKEELYEGCAKVWEIDEFLKTYGFERVETGEWNNGWTDALYLKNRS